MNIKSIMDTMRGWFTSQDTNNKELGLEKKTAYPTNTNTTRQRIVSNIKVGPLQIPMIFVKGGWYKRVFWDNRNGAIIKDIQVQDFYISEKPVPVELWNMILGETPENNWIGQRDGYIERSGLYDINTTNKRINDFVARLTQRSEHPFCLPSEKEWEYSIINGAIDCCTNERHGRKIRPIRPFYPFYEKCHMLRSLYPSVTTPSFDMIRKSIGHGYDPHSAFRSIHLNKESRGVLHYTHDNNNNLMIIDEDDEIQYSIRIYLCIKH